MLSGKDFVCRNLFPQDINNPLKDNRSFHNLSPLGRNIMEKFVKDNDKKEKELRLKDIEYNEYLHSKKKGTENVWKCPKAHGEFFSVPNGDVVTSYKKDKRPKRLIDIPFRILTNLYANENVIEDLEKVRLNPNLVSEDNLRNDLEFYIPQLCTFLLFEKQR